jgi:hypothetical protein
MKFDDLDLEMIFRRIAVEQSRETSLPDLIRIVRDMIASQRRIKVRRGS